MSYGRIEGPEGDRNLTGRPTEPTNLDLWSSPTKEHTQAGPRPPRTYVADVQLDLHVGPEQLELGYLVWPQWEKKCLASQRLEMPG